MYAERTAIYYASAKYSKAQILAMAITAKAKNKLTTTPISTRGSCRQAIVEYEMKQKKTIPLYFMVESGEVMKSDSLQNLLLFVFTADYL